MQMHDKIAQRRKELGLTLEDVAKIVGVGKSTVRKWEAGIIANMRRDNIAALAKALQTTPAYLMGWEKPADETDELLEENIKLFTSLPEHKQEEALRFLRFLQGQ